MNRQYFTSGLLYGQGMLTKIMPRTGSKKNVRCRLPAEDEKLYLL